MEKFTCEKCGKTFKTQKWFDAHMTSKHPTQEIVSDVEEKDNVEKTEFSCDECGEVFATQRGLNDHTKKHLARKERIPMGLPTMKLTTKEKKGVHTHTINDKGDRLQRALDAGYRFVLKDDAVLGNGQEDGNTDLGSYVSVGVGTDDRGNVIRGYKMEIDIDLYNEDQKAKQDIIDRQEGLIKAGKFQNNIKTGYIPDAGISIK